MKLLKELQIELQLKADPEQAIVLQRFFKTGPGEYAEGDRFVGIKVPELRKLSKKYNNLQLLEVEGLIKSLVHEKRLIALFILLEQYKKTRFPAFAGNDGKQLRKVIYDFYVSNMQYVNNWDLVDLSAPHIVGHYLFDKNRSTLKKWSRAKNLWARRISVVSTFYFIRQNDFQDTLNIAFNLLNDKEDLIHKAAGWMLREIGKRDLETEEKFLLQHYKIMPRTMLRYAIERFPESKRQAYLENLL
jgi:3-methyladenine DNA glycosylase AlkD